MDLSKGVKFENIMRDLQGFDHDIKMYVYHKINNRDEEAQTYLNAYKSDVLDILNLLKPEEKQQEK